MLYLLLMCDSFGTQRLDGCEPGRARGGIDAEDETHACCDAHGDDDRGGADGHGNAREPWNQDPGEQAKKRAMSCRPSPEHAEEEGCEERCIDECEHQLE